MGNKIIYTLWFHVIYIFIYLSSIPLFWRRSDIDQNNIAEAIIMLLPSVFSIISLLLLNIETLSMTLCISAWVAVEFCYIDLNAGLYGCWFHVGPFNRSYYNAEHRQFNRKNRSRMRRQPAFHTLHAQGHRQKMPFAKIPSRKPFPVGMEIRRL